MVRFRKYGSLMTVCLGFGENVSSDLDKAIAKGGNRPQKSTHINLFLLRQFITNVHCGYFFIFFE